MAVVLKEQLELRPSVALQKKVGLKSLEQVIRWGDRVNQELCRWRKLEDKKCWRARARRTQIDRKKRRKIRGIYPIKPPPFPRNGHIWVAFLAAFCRVFCRISPHPHP